ncbi:hypothetical protein M9Y10_007950 [Tritrichomonas musculus]|uniref:Uncharacterized protein n=1 Tax=Tritrichomonas musculus TaxID=1915356 RepID=A0ABR2J3J8_9EUKA
MIAVKRDTLNSRAVPENKTHGLAYSLLNECQNNGHYETLIQKRDGSIVKGSDFEISLGHSFMIYDSKLDGYDLVEIHCNQNHHSTSKIDLKDIVLLYLDISLVKSNQTDVMHLSFTIKEKHPSGGINDSATIDIYGALDTIERITYTWSKTSKNISYDESGQAYSNRDIVLYLRHDYTDPIDEVNWDPSTNAFEYIIKQQFYEVSPNPNASTTLYTDFNITSSKIITADNITTMRSDLNLVTNNVDVVSYDVKEVKLKVDALDSQMNEQQMKTKYLEKEVDKIDMKANVGIVLGAVGCVLGATGIGVAGKALSFATKGVEGVVKAGGRELVNTITKASDVGADVLEDMAGKLTDELPDIGFDTWFGDMLSKVTTKSVKSRNVVSRNVLSSTDKLNNIISWCETEFTPVTNIKFTDELDDPSKIAMTLTSTMDLCKRYQHTMKPMIKTLTEGVKNGLSKNDLTRTDVIDVVGKIEDKHIKLFAEDIITDGFIKVKLMVRTISEFNDVDYNEQYISLTITNGDISEFVGTDDFTSAQINVSENKTIITINNPNKAQVTGISVKENTAIRQMTFTSNDLAYTCDIVALNKKIDEIHEQIQENDKTLATTLNEFPTVDEVNTALEKIKNDMINMDDLSNYALKSDIPTNHVTTSQLTSTLNEYMLKSDMPDDYVVVDQLDRYALKSDIPDDYVNVAALEEYMLKSEMPDDYVIAEELNNYVLKSELPNNDITLGSYRKMDNIMVYSEMTVESLTTSSGYEYAKVTPTTGNPNGYHFIGRYIDAITNETVKFDIIWKTSSDQGITKNYYLNGNFNGVRLQYNINTGYVYARHYSNNGMLECSLTLTHVYMPSDSFMLKSEMPDDYATMGDLDGYVLKSELN